jgi:hypothetical protein
MNDFDISTNGKTVWVNSSQGMCVGRFSSKGIDVHRDYNAQMRGESQCLDCRHDLAPDEAWSYFRASMKEHYGVEIPESYRPQEQAEAKRA